MARWGRLRYAHPVRLPRLLVLATASSLVASAGCRLTTEAAPVAAQQTAPDFELPSHEGGMVGLDDLLAQGPAVIVFYRGHW